MTVAVHREVFLSPVEDLVGATVGGLEWLANRVSSDKYMCAGGELSADVHIALGVRAGQRRLQLTHNVS